MKVLRLFSVITLILALGMSVTSCKQVKDADIQNVAQELLIATPDLGGVIVVVKDRVATLTGVVNDATAKEYAESIIAGVENVKSVENQLEIIPPAPDYTNLDAAINTALPELLKDLKTVSSSVKDGVITLTGEIREKELPVLLENLKALNPVDIKNELVVN